MALTKASDILGLKKAVQEIAVPIDSLSASKVTVNLPDFEPTNASDGFEELNVSIAGLSASVLSINQKIESIENMFVYSTTEEKEVGTWIDGKTIYEKTFEFDQTIELTASTWTNDIQIDTSAMEQLINVVVLRKATGGVSSWYGYMQVVNNVSGLLNVFNNRPLMVEADVFILRYTKKTPVESRKKNNKEKK